MLLCGGFPLYELLPIPAIGGGCNGVEAAVLIAFFVMIVFIFAAVIVAIANGEVNNGFV